jgi:hypothetical protein
VNPNEYLSKFFAELERLVDGHGTRHVISSAHSGVLEIRLGAGDWYRATQIVLDEDPIKAAQDVAKAENYWPDVI